MNMQISLMQKKCRNCSANHKQNKNDNIHKREAQEINGKCHV